jgi:hypothetical protein
MLFVEKINIESDLVQIQNDLNEIFTQTYWINNQIGLKHRIGANNKFEDSIGSLYSYEEKKFLAKESDFSEWAIGDNYLKQQIIKLSVEEKFKIGRVRFMRLMPHTGLSVHKDKEIRYHLVLKTNNNSYICQHINASQNSLNPIAVCYHIPKDGNWYKVDTKRNHWVYNGGNEERIHLVVCTF